MSFMFMVIHSRELTAMRSKQCPLCGNATDELLPISNPGKVYKECCHRCEGLATLITQNYPHDHSCFKDPIPVLPVILQETGHRLPLRDGAFLGNEAVRVLKGLREWLSECASDRLRDLKAIDVVVTLSRLFADVTTFMTNEDFLRGISQDVEDQGSIARTSP